MTLVKDEFGDGSVGAEEVEDEDEHEEEEGGDEDVVGALPKMLSM